MESMNNQILQKVRELRNLASETERALEESGISITYIPKEQLFSNNIKKIISAVEGLLRQEPREKHTLRLKTDIQDSYKNIKEIKQTDQGKKHSSKLDKIKELVEFLEKIYEKI
ncbi:hypothetical protein J4216_03490 [Candidatus Woesearchaeota archaeon]|nr:hypothetical protein [Candidatus Woesearchaeota archaeon]